MLEVLAFAAINLLGVISPGPDFAIVTYYGLKGSRRAALLATLGIATAVLIHVFYCIFGVAWFLQNSPILFRCIQLVGASYLGYLGLRMLIGSKKEETSKQQDPSEKAFATGFFTNLLNPKATLFLLSLFNQFITPTTSFALKISFAATVPLLAIGWFSLLSFLITHPTCLPYLQRHQRRFALLMGALLLLLACSVVWNAAV